MKRIVGWREWVVLPLMHSIPIKAKIDTGARTSALHAARIEPFRCNADHWVEFELDRHDLINTSGPFRAPVKDQRLVRNSGGRAEERYLIETILRLGDDEWPIDVTLTGRPAMNFPMLIGRTALRGRFVVDPGRSYLTTKLAGKLQRASA